MSMFSTFGPIVASNIILRFPLDQVNNHYFKVGANSTKLMQHGVVNTPVSLVVLPIFSILGAIVGAVEVGCLGALLSLGHLDITGKGAIVGGLTGALCGGFIGTLISEDVARTFIADRDSDSITKEQSRFLAEIRFYENLVAITLVALVVLRPRLSSLLK